MGLNNAYGINANSLAEPYSLCVSILLILGVIQLGLLLEKIFNFSGFQSSSTQLFSFRAIATAPVYGACMLAVFLFPTVLFGSHARELLFSVALILCLFGAHFVLSLLRLKVFFATKDFRGYLDAGLFKTPFFLCYLFLIGYLLLALSPPTDADDLDYHSGVALALLNEGSWPFTPEWFTSRLAGAGECLIALGYAIGAKQFGSLLQFFGLACISSLLFFPNENSDHKFNSHIALFFLSSPVLLWLTSTSKPLLLPIAMTTLALWHSMCPLIDYASSKRRSLLHLCTAIFLITVASQMKFNFLLSGFLVGIIIIFVAYQIKLLRYLIFFAIIIGAITMFPFSLWKEMHYGGHWIGNLYTLFPGNWPGYASFKNYLRLYNESNFIFPLSLIISAPNQITNIIGLGVIIWAVCLICILSRWARLSLDTKILCCSSLTLVFFGLILGQQGGRFFLEPLAWMLLAIVGMKKMPSFLFSRFVATMTYLQSAITIIGLTICILALFPGSLNESLYQSVMQKRAYQYPEMHSLDSALPQDAILLTDARSYALSPRPTISASYWPHFTNQSNETPFPYLDRIKNQGVTHLQTNQDIASSPWKDCINQAPIALINSQHNSRNPLNAGAPYQVWVYLFDRSKLPDCFKNQ